MRILLLALVNLIFITSSSIAENTRVRIDFEECLESQKGLEVSSNSLALKNGADTGVFFSGILELPIKNYTPILGVASFWKGADAEVNICFSSDGRNFDQCVSAGVDPHTSEGNKKVSTLQFVETGYRYFKITITLQGEKAQVSDFDLFLSNPGETSNKLQTANFRTDTLPCMLPDYLDRDGWCPAGNCPEDPTPQPTTVTHLIVHHSAGSNSSSDWAAVVRIIWDFHVNGNGWDDIGYNWLIDPNGVLYQGRGDNLRGAHFCGNNSGTMGVCMLGTFTSVTPTPEAQNTLVNLLAWKCVDVGIYPLDEVLHSSSGLDLFRISGHRDGCATECPGNAFYPLLPGIRDAVVDTIEANCLLAGVGEVESLDGVVVFPNPVRNELNIEFPEAIEGPVDLILYSMLSGEVVGKWEMGKKNSIMLSELPNGSFLLLITNNDGKVIGRKKIIKML